MDHICKLKKTKLDQNQPALGFFKLQIVDENNADCYACFVKTDTIRKKWKLDWDQAMMRMSHDKDFQQSCLCDLHEFPPRAEGLRYCNLAVLKIETSKRVFFQTHVFADSSLDLLQNISVTESREMPDFTENEISRKPVPKFFGKSYKGTDIQNENFEN